MAHLIDLDKKGHSSTMMQRLNGFRTNHQHCDFKVKVDSEEIPAHRNVLAAGSDYFNAMLSHDTLENQSGVVEIKEADAESVKQCIGFIYTGKITVSEGKYEQLMHVAHLFQLQQLCDEIADFLEARLDAKSFFVTKKLANMYNCKKLEEKCDQFAFEKMKEISQQNEFVELDSAYITSMMKSTDVKASATVKLCALIKWAKYNSAGRRETLLYNLKQLDLSSMSVEHHKFILQNEPVISGDSECLKLLMFSALSNVEARNPEGNGQMPTKIVIFNRESGFLQSFDFVKKTWERMQKMLQKMKEKRFSAVRLDNRVYILMEDRSVHQLEYSNMKAEWEQLPYMLEDHGNPAPVTVFQEFIFVVGGGYSKHTTSVEKYSPSLKKWIKSQDKNVISYYSTPIGSENYLYCIGGYSQTTGRLNQVERFDPMASTWSYVAPMKHARYSPAAAELDAKLYVMGGCRDENLSAVEYFIPQTNTWTTVASMNVPRWGFQSFVIEGSIFVVGDNDMEVVDIEKYNQGKDTWEVVGKCDTDRMESFASFAI